jgi:hypothetical protein
MLKYILALTSLFSLGFSSRSDKNIKLYNQSTPNSCISFSVTSGTGCDWMCNYCANNLKTNNYYFTSGVCQYQSGGCVGNPIANTQYTCCSL